VFVWPFQASVAIRSLAGFGGVLGFLDGTDIAAVGRRNPSAWISMGRGRGTVPEVHLSEQWVAP
jgi:hypothetical protein